MNYVDEFKKFVQANRGIKLIHDGMQYNEYFITKAFHYSQHTTDERIWIVELLGLFFLIYYTLTDDKLSVDKWEVKDFASSKELIYYLSNDFKK